MSPAPRKAQQPGTLFPPFFAAPVFAASVSALRAHCAGIARLALAKAENPS